MSFPRYERYKDSGIEWLGEVPEHWDVLPLKRAFTIVGGSTPSSEVEEYWGDGCVWVTPTDLSKISDRYISQSERTITLEGLRSCSSSMVPAGSIVLSTRAPIGSLAIAGVELCTNQGCKSLVPMPGTVSSAYAFLLSIMTEELQISGKGTTFLEISADALGSVETPKPSTEEQRRIGNFLEDETAKIGALLAEQRRLIELLKEKRQAVIFHAVTKGLTSGVPMKDSGIEWLGETPAQWKSLRMASIYREINDPGTDGLPILSVSIHHGVSDKQLDDDELDRKVTRSDDQAKYKRVYPGDLVYNMMRAWQGGFGTVNIEGMISPAYVVARPAQGLSSRFVELLLRTSCAIEEMRRYSKGVTDFRLRLYWDEFKCIRLSMPPQSEQEAILNYVEVKTAEFDRLTETSEQAIAILQERRSALISAAVTGKIDVRSYTRKRRHEPA